MSLFLYSVLLARWNWLLSEGGGGVRSNPLNLPAYGPAVLGLLSYFIIMDSFSFCFPAEYKHFLWRYLCMIMVAAYQ